MDESKLRADLVTCCKIMFNAGAVGTGTAGHLSARFGENQMLIKPRAMNWKKLTENDLVTMDFNGKPVGVRQNHNNTIIEWPIHTQAYLARPDVNAVLHAHPVTPTVMASLGIKFEPINRETARLTGAVSVQDELSASLEINDREGGDRMAEVLGKNRVLLIRHHGIVVVGKSIPDVCLTAVELEVAAQAMLTATAGRKQPLLPPEETAALMEGRKKHSAPREFTMDERWQMMQDYYL